MYKCKHERFILSLLIERTLFIYNIVLSSSSNITKKYKKKCIRFLIEAQKYFRNTKYQYFDEKSVKYQFNQYGILMNRLDYLLKLFDDIDGSEEFKQIWTNKLLFYISETVNLLFLNPNYDKNYFSDFTEFLRHISIKSLLIRDPSDLIYCNKFYLL